MKYLPILIMASAFAIATTPLDANSLVSAGRSSAVAKSSMSATPDNEWNKLSRSEGKNVEIWTIDGDALNKVMFFGGIETGKPLLRELDKKHEPLPKVASNMLITDIPTLLESTYRSQGVNQMSIDGQEPAMLSGHAAIRFSYSFTREDEVRRRGEGIGALVAGKLYLVVYEAPALHFFDKDLEHSRQLMASMKL